MSQETVLARVTKVAASPGGRFAIRAIASAGGLAGRLGHPVLATVAALSANYLTRLADADPEVTDGEPSEVDV